MLWPHRSLPTQPLVWMVCGLKPSLGCIPLVPQDRYYLQPWHSSQHSKTLQPPPAWLQMITQAAPPPHPTPVLCTLGLECHCIQSDPIYQQLGPHLPEPYNYSRRGEQCRTVAMNQITGLSSGCYNIRGVYAGHFSVRPPTSCPIILPLWP